MVERWVGEWAAHGAALRSGKIVFCDFIGSLRLFWWLPVTRNLQLQVPYIG